MGCPDDALELVRKAYDVMHDYTDDAPAELFARSEDLLEAALAQCPGDSRVVDAVIGYHDDTGPSNGYYGLIWFSLARIRDDYQAAFRYARRIVQIRPRMDTVMTAAAYGIKCIADTAASAEDWPACQVILETGLQWDPTAVDQLATSFCTHAYHAGRAGDMHKALTFVERAAALASDHHLALIVGWTMPEWSDEIDGYGCLGLAMLAVQQGKSKVAARFLAKALELAPLCELESRNHGGFYHVATAADSHAMDSVAHQALKFVVDSERLHDWSLEGIGLARKYKLYAD